MYFTICKAVLGVKEIGELVELGDPGAMVDGRETSAVAGKKNLQLPLGSSAARRCAELLTHALSNHAAFVAATRPVAFSAPLISRYEKGMSYPRHIDAAIMGGLRTDVAVTVFLSPPESYQGGELVINSGACEQVIKLEAGDAVAYPASTFHNVNEVRHGARFVAALWVQSRIKDPSRRDILDRLATLTARYGNTAIGPRLHRSYWNLERLWSEAAPQLHAPGSDS